MPSWMGLSAIGGIALVAVFFIWYALRQAKKQGVAEQLARDNKAVAKAETKIHGVQNTQQDTAKTKKDLKDGNF